MKTYFFGPIYTGKLIKNVIERTYIPGEIFYRCRIYFSQINSAGLVKEVKHYEPAFGEVANAVSSNTTVTFDTAINSKIAVGNEVFGTNLTTNPTVSVYRSNKLSIVVSSAIKYLQILH